MRTLEVGLFAAAAMLMLGVMGCVSYATQEGVERRQVTSADLDQWNEELSNWGRWGPDDEMGALNLITPAKRTAAAALVQDGVSVSLARDAMKEQAIDNPRPYEHVMLGVGSDRLAVSYHGVAHTHLDALAHVQVNGQMYNGYTPEEEVVVAAGGHAKNSIHNVKHGIFTRGILIDIARLKGVPYLGPDTPIYVEDLEAWEQQTGITVSAGDALFVRTGRWARREAVGPWDTSRNGQRPGLHPSVIPWLKERDIAVLGADIPTSVAPSDIPGATGPVHDFALVMLGVHLFDNCDLEAVADAAAQRNRWEFLLTAAPLPIWGGTGSPINPIATF